MVAKFRLLSLFILANAMGSLTMILPASPADRDRGGHSESDSHPAAASRERRPSGAGMGEDDGDLSLLVTHDVFYQPCAGSGDCGGDRGDRGHAFRPDLIGGETPPNPFPFGGGADDGRNRGSGESGHDGGGTGAWSPGAMPSGLFPFLPSAPFADAPGGGRSGGGRSGGGRSEDGHSSGSGAANYPGLAENSGAPHGFPGDGGDWQPIPIPSGAGVSGSGPSVSADDAVPEPASLLLLATASLVFFLFRTRRRRLAERQR